MSQEYQETTEEYQETTEINPAEYQETTEEYQETTEILLSRQGKKPLYLLGKLPFGTPSKTWCNSC
jgi:hypothetical protein